MRILVSSYNIQRNGDRIKISKDDFILFGIENNKGENYQEIYFSHTIHNTMYIIIMHYIFLPKLGDACGRVINTCRSFSSVIRRRPRMVHYAFSASHKFQQKKKTLSKSPLQDQGWSCLAEILSPLRAVPAR